MVGTTLLHYRILKLLGQGGMGEVYLAADTTLNRKVALKVLPPSLRRDPDRLARFRTEAEAAAKLNHPNIAQIYALEETEGLLLIVMEYVDGQPLPASVPRWRRSPLLIAAAAVLMLLTALATWFTAGRMLTPPEPLLRKFQLPLGAGASVFDGPAISPDGTMIAYTQDGRLWIRDLDKTEPRELPGTDGGERLFWSPHSDFVGYFVVTASAPVGATLKTVSVEGGPSTTLCKLPRGFPRGATWNPDGAIVFGLTTTGSLAIAELFEVSAQGGDPRPLMKPDSTNGELAFRYPSFLPDGKTLLFVVDKADTSSELVVQSGDTRTRLLYLPGEQIGYPTYAPSGHLVYQRGWPASNGIWAVPFSLSKLNVTGKPFLVVQTGAFPSVSAEGTLVYRSEAAAGSQQLVWVRSQREGRGPHRPAAGGNFGAGPLPGWSARGGCRV